MSDDELAPWMDALTHLGGAEYCLDRFDLAAAHAERGIAIGRGELFPGLAQTLAGALFSTGRLEEASEVIESVIESARLSDNAVALTWGLVDGAYVALAAGDAGAALRIAQEAKGLVDAMGPGVLAAWAGGIRAAALIDAGEPEEAVAVLVAAGGGEALPRIPGGFRTNFLEILTRAQVAAGRLDDAKRTAQAAADRAESFGLDFSTAVAERACAAVALAAGDAGTAARLAGSSADRAEAVGARLEAAASRLLAGRALVAAGETEPAVDLLERAAEAFAACGADRRRMEVERDLRALGRGPYRRSAPGILDAGGLASLTGREREVADLVAGGRTNPQIAAELFLSIKTVETHMRNIFRKLGVGSRSEVARLVADPDVARSG
jgi:DNA-binding NarL/FixJ family response regulator